MAKGDTVTLEIDGWRVTMEWSTDANHGGPNRLTVEPVDPKHPPVGGISSTVLRDIKFSDARAAVRASREPEYTPDPDRLRAALSEGLTDRYLAVLSAEYIALVDAGRKNPAGVLAEQLGKSPDTIRGQLSQARNKRGILDGRNGKVGGVLTKKAHSLLR
ncbi:hypothetical protein ACFPPE_07240 [Agromyces tardus]|uniref:hypothetical protein n=1 Tax=Agromyces tardus TaxID=2583849 RepID=UPI00360BDFA4